MAELFVPKAQEIYRHFKGGLYQVLAVAEHTETGEQLVIYQAMYEEFKIYARPLEMFAGPVDRARYPEAEQEFRFQLQGPDGARRQNEERQNGQLREALSQEPGDDGACISGAAEWRGGAGKDQVAEPCGPESELQEADSRQEEPGLDPMVLEFLDARTYEQRLNVLAALHHRITNEMITTMSLCCDIEVEGDDVEQRYEELKQCLIMKERFEIKRLV